MNYASTSPVTSPAVVAAITSYLRSDHRSPGRNFEGLEDSAIALDARLALGELLGVRKPNRIIFTSGVTASLNMLINGVVRPGDHVVTTSVEHNAVARPLALLAKNGIIEVTWMRCEPDGSLDPGQVRESLRPNSRLLVMTHASNVLGTILPYRECFAEAKRRGLFTILDAAQTAGCIDVRIGEETDVIAFAGHKGLGGLAGIGGFALGDGAAEKIRPWLVGGTGSASHLLDQPEFLPDKFEPGTPNTVGIVSLAASVKELAATGIGTIRDREKALTARFLEAVRDLPVVVCGTGDADRSMPVVSVTVPGRDMGRLARRLYEDHGVLVRSGLHCSPLAHQTAGTFPEGTLRFSFGRETTPDDIDAGVTALAHVL